MASLLDDSLPSTQNPRVIPEEISGPVTEKFGTLLAGIHTDLVISRFADRTLVVVTQIRKLGKIVQVEKDQVKGPLPSGNRSVYTVSSLLGQNTEETVVLARILAEKLNITKPLILCIGIKDLSPKTIKLIVNFILSKVTTTK